MCIYIYVYIHTSIHTYMHTYVETNINVHILVPALHIWAETNIYIQSASTTNSNY